MDSPRDVATRGGRRFDVQPSTDPRSADYPVRAVLAREVLVEPRRKLWNKSKVLDQGQEGACVGHGVTGELGNTPTRVYFPNEKRLSGGAPHDAQEFAFWLYRQAQAVDEWPGVNYEGTSVNAGMKVCRDLGFYDSYHWVKTRDEFVQALMTLGPVVIAIPWHEEMYDAPGGELVVGGEQVGWHCLLANGYDPALKLPGKPKREMVRLQNSWGPEWGDGGLAWIEMETLWYLLSDEGSEAVAPVGRHRLNR